MTDLTTLFQAGVAAVRGDSAVAASLTTAPIAPPDRIIAVGKAATAMAQAAHMAFPKVPVLIITKYGHAAGAPAGAEVIEAAHPVLDSQSLMAGARLLEVTGTMAPTSHLLLLISGGASALAEAPQTALGLEDLRHRAQEMLASGADIHAMNAARKEMSRIKGGKLLAGFPGAAATTLTISDVEGDDLTVIGSGLGAAPSTYGFTFETRIVASNAIARAAVAQAAQKHPVQTNDETLYDDIHTLAPRIAKALKQGPEGLHIWGGEPTVILPPDPGRGGRNQALAALLAREIAGTTDLQILVAGTDGTDGPTDAAGAIVDGTTWEPAGQNALDRADSGSWLAQRGALLTTGPTGTNVMDLVIALKS
ncbi:DUF4147 domain-containing protein [uncultured Roseobacter sp.]|uniref:DUF4147 domain-containing protein n=1 Tax=uncultured Roseobacter sp. TaxID=114847 RepID=UPI002612ADC6|nr:DUF4147 domain-containing protein [uncultured Roseobacter sp.]